MDHKPKTPARKPILWNWADPSGYGVPGKPITQDQFYTEDVFYMLVPDPETSEPSPLPAPRPPAPIPEAVPPPPGVLPPPTRPAPPTPDRPYPDFRPETRPELLPPWFGPPPTQLLPTFPARPPRCAPAEVAAARALIQQYEKVTAEIAALEAAFAKAPRDHQEALARQIGKLQEQLQLLEKDYERGQAVLRGCST